MRLTPVRLIASAAVVISTTGGGALAARQLRSVESAATAAIEQQGLDAVIPAFDALGNALVPIIAPVAVGELGLDGIEALLALLQGQALPKPDPAAPDPEPGTADSFGLSPVVGAAPAPDPDAPVFDGVTGELLDDSGEPAGTVPTDSPTPPASARVLAPFLLDFHDLSWFFSPFGALFSSLPVIDPCAGPSSGETPSGCPEGVGATVDSLIAEEPPYLNAWLYQGFSIDTEGPNINCATSTTRAADATQFELGITSTVPLASGELTISPVGSPGERTTRTVDLTSAGAAGWEADRAAGRESGDWVLVSACALITDAMIEPRAYELSMQVTATDGRTFDTALLSVDTTPPVPAPDTSGLRPPTQLTASTSPGTFNLTAYTPPGGAVAVGIGTPGSEPCPTAGFGRYSVIGFTRGDSPLAGWDPTFSVRHQTTLVTPLGTPTTFCVASSSSGNILQPDLVDVFEVEPAAESVPVIQYRAMTSDPDSALSGVRLTLDEDGCGGTRSFGLPSIDAFSSNISDPPLRIAPCADGRPTYPGGHRLVTVTVHRRSGESAISNPVAIDIRQPTDGCTDCRATQYFRIGVPRFDHTLVGCSFGDCPEPNLYDGFVVVQLVWVTLPGPATTAITRSVGSATPADEIVSRLARSAAGTPVSISELTREVSVEFDRAVTGRLTLTNQRVTDDHCDPVEPLEFATPTDSFTGTFTGLCPGTSYVVGYEAADSDGRMGRATFSTDVIEVNPLQVTLDMSVSVVAPPHSAVWVFREQLSAENSVVRSDVVLGSSCEPMRFGSSATAISGRGDTLDISARFELTRWGTTTGTGSTCDGDIAGHTIDIDASVPWTALLEIGSLTLPYTDGVVSGEVVVSYRIAG